MQTIESEDVFLKAAFELLKEKGLDEGYCSRNGYNRARHCRDELYELHQKIAILKKFGIL